jgi:aminoglycoside 2'-N-acetyltransferase I
VERWRGPTFVRLGDRERATPEEDGFVMILRTPRTPASLDLDAPISCDWREGDVW